MTAPLRLPSLLGGIGPRLLALAGDVAGGLAGSDDRPQRDPVDCVADVEHERVLRLELAFEDADEDDSGAKDREPDAVREPAQHAQPFPGDGVVDVDYRSLDRLSPRQS